MKLRSIVFDLDGVLVDTCNYHYLALNQALTSIAGAEYIITETEHENVYNGLSTRKKLELLTANKNLSIDLHDNINKEKQRITDGYLSNLTIDNEKITILKSLRSQGYKLYCASNCIRSSVDLILNKIGILNLFDSTFSNEDVANCKPSPDIYLKVLSVSGINAAETLIFEDSYIGLSAAIKSGCNVCPVKNSKQLTLDYIMKSIKYYESDVKGIVNKNLLTKTINIVIPMAGDGSRFAKVGYKDPKPLIDVFNLPMISWVVRNIGFDANYTYITKREHLERYKLDKLLNTITPGCNIITVDSTTEGAACTVLLAEKIINTADPLLICNSDQCLEWDCFQFVFEFLYNNRSIDAKISTFISDGNTKWSYAKLDNNNLVCEVAEKKVISEYATTGFYLWRHGCDFVRSALQMIQKNIRVNNEFYVCPVFNEAILDGKRVTIENCKRMWGLGVPEDLDYFHSNFNL
jgi:HAD superfamily hydrolase (TIGR01509 family)